MRVLGGITLVIGTVIGLSSFEFNSVKFENFHAKDLKSSSGAPAGYTGAPGDNGNCTTCHMGTVQQAASVVDLTFSGMDEYVLGNIYTLDISLTGGTAKNGFQIVALRDSDDTNVGAWSVTAPNDMQESTQAGRNYITHTQTGNTLTSWSVDWVAPVADEGYVTFYLANNIANSDGSITGDAIYLTELRIASPATVGVTVNQMENVWKVSNFDNKVLIEGYSSKYNDIELTLFNLQGKEVYSNELRNQKGTVQEWVNTENLKSGIYLINLRIADQLITKKIFI